MIEWFRAGKALPKRLVWEIILAAQDVLKQESSLVEVDIEEGLTLDVMGDTHGESGFLWLRVAAFRRRAKTRRRELTSFLLLRFFSIFFALPQVNSTIFSTSSPSLDLLLRTMLFCSTVSPPPQLLDATLPFSC